MSPTKVLIVEDEVIIAHSLARILKRLGYNVIEMVTSGEDAIQAAETHHPDIILMDIVIQGDLNGIQAASAIIQALNIPIIYVTAYTDEDTLHQIRHVGGYGFLVKPYKKEQLHAAIQLALGQHQHHITNNHQPSSNGPGKLLNREEILSIGEQLFSCSHPSLTVIAVLTVRILSNTPPQISVLREEKHWIQQILLKIRPNLEEQDLIGQLDSNEFLMLSYMRTPEESKKWTNNIIQQIQPELDANSTVPYITQSGFSYSYSTDKDLNTLVKEAYQEMESSTKISTELLIPS